MRIQPRLSVGEKARVVDRLGWSEPVIFGAPISTDDIVEKLASPVAEDHEHWVYSPAERFRVLQSLLMVDGTPWIARFGFLMAMSIVIATLGLSNDQPAAVIAAMVVAPMMTPVLGIAASMILGLVHHALRLALIVAVATVSAVALGWLISTVFVVHEITGEELSRTAPRLRDLVIALAAGAAGMYSIVRKDLSGVVPGVAIAVALVPPLATIGILLELQEWTLARGAALLYGVNVVAVIVAALVVLLATDFVDSPSVRDPKILASGAVLTAMSVALIVPLWLNSRGLDRDAAFLEHAATTVLEWESAHPGYQIVNETIDAASVSLVISGPSEPPALGQLRADLATADVADPVIRLVWVQGVTLGADE